VAFPSREELEEATADGPAFIDATTAEGDDLRIYVEPVEGVGDTTFYFQVGRSIEPEQAAIRRLFFIMGAGGLAGLLLAGVSGYWLAGRALRPIRRSVEAQRTFVADASHELRTPLTLIRATAEVMQLEGGPGKDNEGLNDIIKETDRLSYLVGQMLTLARVDSDGVEVAKEPVDLGAIVRDVGRQMALLGREKGVSLTVESGTGTVLGDEQRLGELAIILMDNAIKYTEPGGSIMATLTKEGKRVRFVVADTGRGIPAESLGRVFERFYRVDKGRSREAGGTGLGLPIAKWIVESHGGTIGIESVVGVGTTVTVVLDEADEAGLVKEEVAVEPEAGLEVRS
jgi:signal transduction histidine kinase